MRLFGEYLTGVKSFSDSIPVHGTIKVLRTSVKWYGRSDWHTCDARSGLARHAAWKQFLQRGLQLDQ